MKLAIKDLRRSKMCQEKQLEPLIPDSDQRVKPRQTRLYVTLIVVLCLLLLGLVLFIFIIFPRPINVSYVGVKSASVSFDQMKRAVYLNITSTLEISNTNFYPIDLTDIMAEVVFTNDVIGKTRINDSLLIKLRSERQVDYTVPTLIADEMSYVFDYCTLATIKEHNIGVQMEVVLTTQTYFGEINKTFLETFQYVDCGANTTAPYSSPEE